MLFRNMPFWKKQLHKSRNQLMLLARSRACHSTNRTSTTCSSTTHLHDLGTHDTSLHDWGLHMGLSTPSPTASRGRSSAWVSGRSRPRACNQRSTGREKWTPLSVCASLRFLVGLLLDHETLRHCFLHLTGKL
jgi:hypothetical protein